MAITLSDVLWYWDHRRGEVPTIGGTPVFSRAGSAYERGPNGIHIPRGVDTPRIEPEGMLLELSHTNLLGAPFELDGTSPWTMQGSYTVSAVGSIYSDRSAYKWPNPGDTTSRGTYQTIGTLTGSPETLSVDVENVDADETSIGIYDITAANWVARLKFDWATRVASVDASAVGTATSAHAVKLADVGPSGGPVYRLIVTCTPNNSGNTRRIYIHPSGVPINTKTAILHAAQHVEAGLATSMVEGTRSADSFYWENPPPPQEFVTYFKYRALMKGAGGISAPRVWTLGDSVSSSVGIFIDSSGQVRIGHWGSTSSVGASVAVVPNVGDTIEICTIFYSDDTGRMIVSHNGAAVVSVGVGAPSGGIGAAWDVNKLALNARAEQASKGASKHEFFKIVKRASLTAATDGTADQAVMDEMRGMYVSPDGLRVSNAIA